MIGVSYLNLDYELAVLKTARKPFQLSKSTKSVISIGKKFLDILMEFKTVYYQIFILNYMKKSENSMLKQKLKKVIWLIVFSRWWTL